VAFAAIGLGSFACWVSGGQSFNTAIDQLNRAAKDMDSAVTTGKTLNSTGQSMLKELDKLNTQCSPEVLALIEPQLAPTVAQLKQFLLQISQYIESVSPLSTRIDDVQGDTGDLGWVSALVFALPLGLVAAGCVIIFLAVMATRGFGGAGMARCNDCCLTRCGSPLITLAVFIAAIIAAAECAFGVAAASFCSNADENVLAYSQNFFGADTDQQIALTYYVTGTGSNPYNSMLIEGKDSINEANDTFASLDIYEEAIKANCDGWTKAGVMQDIQQIDPEIDSALVLISRENIYPYYDTLMHDDMCSTVIVGLGWLVVCQLVVGLIFLPVLSLLSASFFTKWAAWQESVQTGLLQNPNEVYIIESQVNAELTRSQDREGV
jgi:hypothetical protein